MPPVYDLPDVPLSFPRTEWYDSEWWRLDTKWHRMARVARITSWRWLENFRLDEKDEEISPWDFKLAVFDRAHQINHQLRRLRQYIGVHATVKAWQDETDKITRLAFDEAVLALPPKSSCTHPEWEEVRDFVRIVLDHDYVRGKDAEPEFTATSDWDESEYTKDFRWHEGTDRIYTWPGSIDKAERMWGNNTVHFCHPARSLRPDEWRPWKYPVMDNWDRFGPGWYRELDFAG